MISFVKPIMCDNLSQRLQSGKIMIISGISVNKTVKAYLPV